MRLATAPHCSLDVDREGVHFKMDTGTKLIPCLVTRDALVARAVRDGLETRDQGVIFGMFRGAIEAVARVQFEAGIMYPMVSRGQV
jgi:hypothetical protein